MTTVVQPTLNAEWQYRLAMAISHPLECGAAVESDCTFKLLTINAMQRKIRKSLIFSVQAISSLFQLIPAYFFVGYA